MTAPRRAGLWFVVVVASYAVAAAITLRVSGHQVRPLYEGVGPAAPYRWVRPPAQFKATNVKPSSGEQTIPLTSGGSAPAGPTSGDGQLVLSFPAGAIAPAPGATSVAVSITPVDPARLGPLPPALYSDGNAYHVTATYQPSGRTITSARKPIGAVVVEPVGAAEFLLSTDGKTWRPIDYHHIAAEAAVATTFTEFGYLLTVANNSIVTNPTSGSTRILIVVVLGLVAVIPIAAGLLWRRRRSGP